MTVIRYDKLVDQKHELTYVNYWSFRTLHHQCPASHHTLAYVGLSSYIIRDVHFISRRYIQNNMSLKMKMIGTRNSFCLSEHDQFKKVLIFFTEFKYEDKNNKCFCISV